MGVEYVSVLMPQLPKLSCSSSAMLDTMAAEFGASGTSAGSGVFHGPRRANPLSGWPWPRESPCCPASAGAPPAVSVKRTAATTDPHLLPERISPPPSPPCLKTDRSVTRRRAAGNDAAPRGARQGGPAPGDLA